MPSRTSRRDQETRSPSVAENVNTYDVTAHLLSVAKALDTLIFPRCRPYDLAAMDESIVESRPAPPLHILQWNCRSSRQTFGKLRTRILHHLINLWLILVREYLELIRIPTYFGYHSPSITDARHLTTSDSGPSRPGKAAIYVERSSSARPHRPIKMVHLLPGGSGCPRPDTLQLCCYSLFLRKTWKRAS